jgi:glycosyltransferase involved in cell wall biosynthesis
VLGDAGILVPARHPSALADALARLLDDAALRATLGAAARRRAEAHFDARRQTARLVALMHEARETWATRPSTA